MNSIDIKALKLALPDFRLTTDVSWKDISILGVGSPMKVLAEPANDIELVELLKFCSEKSFSVRAIGAGGNIIGSDIPFDGVLIRLLRNNFARVIPSHIHVTVGAGKRLSDFLKECAAIGLGGVHALAGIPGTIGGAVRMNAGAHGVEIKDIVEELCGFALDGSQWCMDAKKLNWQYRKVDIPDDCIITVAIFKLKKVDPDEELAKINDECTWRSEHFPSGRSTGCVFRNPFPGLSAGKLIDKAGCRGRRNAGALISDIHANYILNEENATEKAYTDLVIEARTMVLEHSGIYLSPEVHFIDSNTEKRVKIHPSVINVIVLKGGNSNEREISLTSADGVEKALQSAGYNVKGIDIRNLEEWDNLEINKQSDVVFPVLHGGFGENGEIQALMERDGVAFVGCDSRSSYLSMDKIASKKIMSDRGIPTPAYAVVKKGDHSFPENLNYPVVVKPPEEGSTVGITLVKNREEWDDALEFAFKYCDKALIEEFIEGKEITVGILGEKALPVVEIQFPGTIFDFDAKYEHSQGETIYLCPPETVPFDLQVKAQKIALDFAKALNSRDLNRIDLMIDKDDNLFVLEANNMPGFTSSSLLPKSAAEADIIFPQLCGMLVQMAAGRRESLNR
jgi:UDP-N-acetylenolpyruvoylglucosamine reductase